VKRFSEKMKPWLQEHEKRIASIALVAGFIFDNLTLRRVDLLIENIIFIGYLLITAACIMTINLIDAGKWQGKFFERLHPWLAIAMQFCFGNLFSAFFVFYFRSASLVASFPFLLFLAAILIINERLKKQYERIIFQISVLFLALFSYLIFLVPTVIGILNEYVFIASGLLSLILIALFIRLMFRLVPDRVKKSRVGLFASVIGIWATIVIFYFTNVLPPIPLAMKEAGIYHTLEKVGTTLKVQAEVESWWQRLLPYKMIHLAPGQPLYVYSAVFSPTRLDTDIIHNWQYYNSKKGWVSVSKIRFQINGGRDGGYRGYSKKNNLTPGWWRVDVTNPRGQVIGRMLFTVAIGNYSPKLYEEVQ